MQFYKYHGTGNDFVCIDNRSGSREVNPQQVQYLCDRNFGIGADGVIVMSPSETGDIFMDYRNHDGTIAEMCGNGVRVSARFAHEQWGVKTEMVQVETRDGVKSVKVLEGNQYQVNMGAPVFDDCCDFPSSSYIFQGVEWYFVSMGNPHAVAFFPDEVSQQEYMNKYASELCDNTELFPNKINVSSFWRKHDQGEGVFGVKTFERGCGFTKACGTAASGCFAWIQKTFPEILENIVQIDIPGGTLLFEYSDLDEILMTGPAEYVFQGEISEKKD